VSFVDGAVCGYLDEMAVPTMALEVEASRYWVAPFGEGLNLWVKSSRASFLN